MGAAVEEVVSALGIARPSLLRLVRAGEVVHVLTHRRMVVTVMRGELPPGSGAPRGAGPRSRRRGAWPLPSPEYDAIEPVAFEALASRPHATLVRKILAVAVAKVAARGLRSPK